MTRYLHHSDTHNILLFQVYAICNDHDHLDEHVSLSQGHILRNQTDKDRNSDCPCLVAVGFDELEHKAPVHEGHEVVQEEGQTDVHLLGLLRFLKTRHDTKHTDA